MRRLTSESRPSVVKGKQYLKRYQYNQKNQLISIKETGYSPLGVALERVHRYGYDGNGRLAWVDGPLKNGKMGTSKDSDIISFSYTKTGQLKNIAMPMGLSNQYAYDDTGRLLAYTDSAGIKTEMGYNSERQVQTTQLLDQHGEVAQERQANIEDQVLQDLNNTPVQQAHIDD